MKVLILGGTVFLGRHLVEDALARGHEITLFNRGKRNPDLFPEVEKLQGDRDGDLASLAGRKWDVAIDTCGYVPRVVKASAELLSDAVEHYSFVSSLSAYKDFSTPDQDETAPVATMEDETVEEVTGDTYGPLKVLCEQAAERAMPGRVLNVRAGLIVGPYDQSDRFTYWPHRVALGGEVLAPGDPAAFVQFIDVRDLAACILTMAEKRKAGAYNVTGAPRTVSMANVLDESKRASGSNATFTWVSEEFLSENNVQPWMEMPLWIPGEEAIGFNSASIAKATADGLTLRPLSETVRDTLAWDATRPADHVWKAGISAEREAELLSLWRSRAA